MKQNLQKTHYTAHNSADNTSDIEKFIDPQVLDTYDVYSYRHAAALFRTVHPNELAEIEHALMNFSLTKKQIAYPGGNESLIPKFFSKELRPFGWNETRIQGDLVIRVFESNEKISVQGKLQKSALKAREPVTLENYIDGHKIDYVKGKVALDLEWNSKDQTFDRDLYAFSMFHECGIIDAAAIITRSEKMNEVFNTLPLLRKDGTIDYDSNGNVKYCRQKYGASTTWMGKLLYRLNAGRHGGCPVLVFGITPKSIIA